jgi:hypothetical protein
MKALIICPDEREAVSFLARIHPLALAPFLGKPLIDHALTWLADVGAKEITILASDRPEAIREFVHAGEAWGLKIEVIAESEELAVDTARQKYALESGEGWLAKPNDVLLLDRLPQRPNHLLLESYATWKEALEAFLPEFAACHVGAKEISEGIWAGLNADISPGAKLTPPVWIGDYCWIENRAVVGPHAFLEMGTMVDDGASVEESYVGSHTYVGRLTDVRSSFAWGNGLLNWRTGSAIEIVDAFLLCDLKDRNLARKRSTVLGRIIALVLLLVSWPLILLALIKNLGSGKSLFERRAAFPAPRPAHRMNAPMVPYRRLNGFRGKLKRWPELWNVVIGNFCWVGNRPLTAEQVEQLENEFEELWLEAPIGLVSLADAEACGEAFGDESRAHASYFAVKGNNKLRRKILMKVISRAFFG